MNNIRAKAGRCGKTAVLAVMVLMCATASWGVSVTFKASGTINHLISNESGAPLAVGSYLQLIRSPDAIKNPPGNLSGAPSGNDVIIETATIGEGSGNVPGTFIKYVEEVTNEGYVYVRAWNANSPGSATRYGDSNVKQVGVSPPYPPEDFDVAAFATTIMKSAPVIGSVVASGVDHDDAYVTVNVGSQYKVTSGTSYLSGHSYMLEYKKSFESWTSAATVYSDTSLNSAGFALEGLDTGQQYDVRAKAANFFGESASYGTTDFTTVAYPGEVSGYARDLRIHRLGGGSIQLTWEANDTNTCEVYATFEAAGEFVYVATVGVAGGYTYTDPTPGTEKYYRVKAENGLFAPQTVGVYTFSLSKSTTGINSISLPLDTNIPGNSPLVRTASDVDAALGSYFEFIGGWDKATQSEFAYLNGGTGVNFPIRKGEGYQISVSSNTTWVVVGEK